MPGCCGAMSGAPAWCACSRAGGGSGCAWSRPARRWQPWSWGFVDGWVTGPRSKAWCCARCGCWRWLPVVGWPTPLRCWHWACGRGTCATEHGRSAASVYLPTDCGRARCRCWRRQTILDPMKQLFRDVDGGPLSPEGSVACIGAFDGLHLGHRALVGHATERARALGLPLATLSFEPLPREFFAPDAPPPRLMLPRARAEGLFALGADLVGLLRFNRAFAAMSPDGFAERVLARRLRAREVWVGPGFRYGNRRAGDLGTLQAAGERLGFSAGEIAPVMLDGGRVSSTRIRAALVAGDFTTAARLLGHAYAIGGRVVRG